MKRRLLNLLTLLSLLLCVAVCVLWVLSHRTYGGVTCYAAGREVLASHYRGRARVSVFDPPRRPPPSRWVVGPVFAYAIRRSPRGTRYYLDDRGDPVQADVRWEQFLNRFTLGPRGTVRRSAGFVLARRNAPAPGLDFTIVQTPYPALATVAAAPLLRPLAGAARRRRRRSRGLCPRCGYDLRDTPDRCPECGTAAGCGRSTAAASSH
jgi:hypothetical protein